MQRTITTVLLGGLIILHTTASATKVLAQCSFERPTKGSATDTGHYDTSLVQAFVPIDQAGGNADNTVFAGTTQPARKPPETINHQREAMLNYTGGWHFSAAPDTSWGRLRLTRINSTQDVRVRLRLRNIVNDNQVPVNTAFDGQGKLQLIIRSTFDDVVNHDMTMIDTPVAPKIDLIAGNGDIDMSLAAIIAHDYSWPSFPPCTSHEIVSVEILDVNDSVFAVPGVRTNTNP